MLASDEYISSREARTAPFLDRIIKTPDLHFNISQELM